MAGPLTGRGCVGRSPLREDNPHGMRGGYDEACCAAAAGSYFGEHSPSGTQNKNVVFVGCEKLLKETQDKLSELATRLMSNLLPATAKISGGPPLTITIIVKDSLAPKSGELPAQVRLKNFALALSGLENRTKGQLFSVGETKNNELQISILDLDGYLKALNGLDADMVGVQAVPAPSKPVTRLGAAALAAAAPAASPISCGIVPSLPPPYQGDSTITRSGSMHI